jgi:hypothetical protein
VGANKLLPVEQVASLSTPYNAYGVFVSEAQAYVADGLTGLRIVDALLPPRERSAIWKRWVLPGVYRAGRLRLRRGRYVRAACS